MKAHELLSDESKWTKGTAAKSASGRQVYPTSDKAICWCVLGALEKCYPEYDSYHASAHKLSTSLSHYISDWNDAPERTFAELHAKLVELDL